MVRVPKPVQLFLGLVTINLVAWSGRGEIVPANRRMTWQGNVGCRAAFPTALKSLLTLRPPQTRVIAAWGTA